MDWTSLLTEAVKALVSGGASAAVGAATPKYGMTQPGQVSPLATPDASQGFSRLFEGGTSKPAKPQLTIQDLQRLGGM